MSWNYRIMKHDDDGEVWYGVHEVFCDDDGRLSWTEYAIFGASDSPQELIEDVKLMLSDIKKYKNDILEYGGNDTP